MDKYKKAYQDRIKSRIFSGDNLRIMCFVSAGVFIASFKWFIGLPLATMFILFGQFIESNLNELRREI